MADEARVLDALGDPTRRTVLELLRGGERSVRELTDATGVSQPAVSQHLRVLREAGLVTVRADGTRRLHRVDLDGLSGVRAWVDRFWDDALDAFVKHAEDGEQS
jgi:DNA-binding transcriptional ArsR family regulator